MIDLKLNEMDPDLDNTLSSQIVVLFLVNCCLHVRFYPLNRLFKRAIL